MSNNGLIENERDTAISRERLSIALEANAEIEQLCKVLRGCAKQSAEGLAIRGLSVRIEQLSRICMGALSDEAHAISDLALSLRVEDEEATV